MRPVGRGHIYCIEENCSYDSCVCHFVHSSSLKAPASSMSASREPSLARLIVSSE